MTQNMVSPSPLDNDETAQIAWTRFRRLMKWMVFVSVAAVIVALVGLRWKMGAGLTVPMMVATAAGVGFSVMLGAALMGLVFLSSGTGHDEAIDDPFANDPEMKP